MLAIRDGLPNRSVILGVSYARVICTSPSLANASRNAS